MRAPENDREGEAGPEEIRTGDGVGGVGPGAGGEAVGGDAGEADRKQRQNISDGDEGGGGEHRKRVVALRAFDLLGDGGGVVPAHIVPERDGDGAGEVVAQWLEAA